MEFMRDQMHFLAEQKAQPFAYAIISMNMVQTVQKHVQEHNQKLTEKIKNANVPALILDQNIKIKLVQLVTIIIMETNVKRYAMELLLIKSAHYVKLLNFGKILHVLIVMLIWKLTPKT